MVKRQLRNKKVSVSALKQIEFAGVSVAAGAAHLDHLYVRQRFEEMVDILGEIASVEARSDMAILKSEIMS